MPTGGRSTSNPDEKPVFPPFYNKAGHPKCGIEYYKFQGGIFVDSSEEESDGLADESPANPDHLEV